MNIKPLFSIIIEHQYFSNKNCCDLSIKPTPGCLTLLKKYHLLYRSSGDGSIVILSVDNEVSDLLKSIPTNPGFTFFIVMNDPGFVHYTRPPDIKAGEILYYSNSEKGSDSPGELYQSSIKFSGDEWPGTVKLYGLVTIFNNEFFTDRFIVPFKAAGSIWKYYLVTNTNAGNLIIDGSKAGITFEKKTEASDNVLKAVTSSFATAGTSVYVSAGEVPFQDKGIKNIRLVNADSNTVLISHLPNPGLKENGIKIINACI